MEEMALQNEHLEKAGLMRRKLSSSALKLPKGETKKEMQRKACSRDGRKAGSGGEAKETDGGGLALLTTSTALSGRRERACLSCWYGSWSERGMLLERALEGAEEEGREGADFCRLMKGGNWTLMAQGERKLVEAARQCGQHRGWLWIQRLARASKK